MKTDLNPLAPDVSDLPLRDTSHLNMPDLFHQDPDIIPVSKTILDQTLMGFITVQGPSSIQVMWKSIHQ